MYSPRIGRPGYERAIVLNEIGSAATATSNPTFAPPVERRASPLKRDGGVLSPSRCVMSASRNRTSVQIESSVAVPEITPLRRGNPSLRNCGVRRSERVRSR